MKYEEDDGGRAAAGFKGTTGDCVTRAIAIVTGKPYQEVYDDLNKRAKKELGKKGRTGKKRKSNARMGVFRSTYDKYLKDLGATWTPTMKIGSGCKVHLREEELPKGRIIVRLSKHIAAVIDGIIHDTYDPSRKGTRCVYGYYTMPENIK